MGEGIFNNTFAFLFLRSSMFKKLKVQEVQGSKVWFGSGAIVFQSALVLLSAVLRCACGTCVVPLPSGLIHRRYISMSTFIMLVCKLKYISEQFAATSL
jgi:hypothetical protein